MMKLQFSTNVRQAAILIEEGEVQPYIDYKDTRFIIHVDRVRGMVLWTPFSISLQERIGPTYSYPYASHSILLEALMGPRSKRSPQDPIITEWPDFPVPEDKGVVLP